MAFLARSFRENPVPASGTRSREFIRFRCAGREFILRQTILEPGGQSGWHYHDGTLFVLVTGGPLNHPATDCVPVTKRPWRIFREPSGRAHAHLARNLGDRPVRLTVVYVNPAGSPLSRSIAPPER
ncbi:cupin domain-containing protein [Nocardia acidivorans]|uniref:cupin domain-containing protein n=1 Tax=Nocardia acidivorans TaxID=404580 RepID=UPI00082D5A4B|nr:cupin domain-containing protein [Nocardia acidivorans]